MSKQNQWIVGINAVASAIEHDAETCARCCSKPAARTRASPRSRRTRGARASTCAASPSRRWTAWPAAGAPPGRGRALCGGEDLGRARTGRAGRSGRRQGAGAGAGRRAGPAQPRRLPAQRRGAGATAVVIPKDKAAPVNATVRKTSAGAADRMPVVSGDQPVALPARPAEAGRVDLRPGRRGRAPSCTRSTCAATSRWCWAARPTACAG
jgi:23S rRNA (guanosine2251-2'-O)-methyltransferase